MKDKQTANFFKITKFDIFRAVLYNVRYLTKKTNIDGYNEKRLCI